MKHPGRQVFKFGGASVDSPEAIINVSKIIREKRVNELVVVVSAMGKITNALEKLVQSYINQDLGTLELLKQVKSTHYEYAAALFDESHSVFDRLNDAFVEIDWILEDAVHDPYDYLYDQIVSIGELLSSHILAAYLTQSGIKAKWIDARDLIITDDTFRAAKVDWEETEKKIRTSIEPLIMKGTVVVTQGFIGSTPNNETTTLGREGSDFTAAVLSYCLDAEGMSIWKDVPGVLTADPRIFKSANKLSWLSYAEAIEMTYYGAKVIHPKTIKPLQNKSIPLFVKSFENPDGEGTSIKHFEEELMYPPIVVVEPNQVLLHISTNDFSFVAENHLSVLFKYFDDHRIKVNVMQNSALKFMVCVTDAGHRLNELISRIEKEFNIDVEKNLELITIRHFNESLLEKIKQNKRVLFEERLRDTIQIVTKDLSLAE